mmetsp:Transcript_32185/g.96100  ORF Transcript_32185/g.96100 Transcript_32185/m.96100 type:complete len:273 (+) Transcript_32185:2044-2862(+)
MRSPWPSRLALPEPPHMGREPKPKMSQLCFGKSSVVTSPVAAIFDSFARSASTSCFMSWHSGTGFAALWQCLSANCSYVSSSARASASLYLMPHASICFLMSMGGAPGADASSSHACRLSEKAWYSALLVEAIICDLVCISSFCSDISASSPRRSERRMSRCRCTSAPKKSCTRGTVARVTTPSPPAAGPQSPAAAVRSSSSHRLRPTQLPTRQSSAGCAVRKRLSRLSGLPNSSSRSTSDSGDFMRLMTRAACRIAVLLLPWSILRSSAVR